MGKEVIRLKKAFRNFNSKIALRGERQVKLRMSPHGLDLATSWVWKAQRRGLCCIEAGHKPGRN